MEARAIGELSDRDGLNLAGDDATVAGTAIVVDRIWNWSRSGICGCMVTMGTSTGSLVLERRAPQGARGEEVDQDEANGDLHGGLTV